VGETGGEKEKQMGMEMEMPSKLVKLARQSGSRKEEAWRSRERRVVILL
jgi:hypothetical protein